MHENAFKHFGNTSTVEVRPGVCAEPPISSRSLKGPKKPLNAPSKIWLLGGTFKEVRVNRA